MIDLPYPSPALSPNARVHWRKKHAAAKKHRAWAHAGTLAAKVQTPAERPIRLLLTMYPATRRNRDRDNALASLKSTLDGIADALGVDDSAFDARIQWGEPVANPRVVVTIDSDARPIGEIIQPIMARIAAQVEEA